MSPAATFHSDAPIYGTFTLPLWDDIPQTDPASRPYLAPPKASATIQRTYPVIDFRDEVFPTKGPSNDTNTSASAAYLRKNGFTALCSPTKMESREAFESAANMQSTYYPEVMDMVRRLTGCKVTQVTNSIVRTNPTISLTVSEKIRTANAKSTMDSISHQIHLSGLPPVRQPHIDFTPLGARQELRFWRKDITESPNVAKIVAYEDAICRASSNKAAQPIKAGEKNSIGPIDEAYNGHADGILGPRYAAYSIWRPVLPITRDPLAFAPYHTLADDPELKMWQYDVREPGYAGDWHRQLEMAKVRPDCQDGAVCESLKWYYCSDLQPDECLVLKLFDSASLGVGAEEAAGVLHASPDIGDAAYGGLRESVEVRVLAIW